MDKYEKMRALDQDILHLQTELTEVREQQQNTNKEYVYPIWKELEDRANSLLDQIHKKKADYSRLLNSFQYSLF